MLELLLISLTLLATCFFGIWQVVVVPKRAKLESLASKVNELRSSHIRLFQLDLRPDQYRRHYEIEERVRFTELYEEVFLDITIARNTSLPETAKEIIEIYRDIRQKQMHWAEKHEFAEALIAQEQIPLELDFEELAIIIEFAIKKVPYHAFRIMNSAVWISSVRRKRSKLLK